MAKKKAEEQSLSQNNNQDLDQNQPEVNNEEAAEEQSPKSPKGKFFGNKDADRKYPIDAANDKYVVVRQAQVKRENGGMIEIPNTESIQTYHPQVYDKLLKDKFFSDAKMKVDVLHDPR